MISQRNAGVVSPCVRACACAFKKDDERRQKQEQDTH
jgi:hypothetical protein